VSSLTTLLVPTTKASRRTTQPRARRGLIPAVSVLRDTHIRDISTIQRPWPSYNPIQGATSGSIACNDDGSSGSNQLTATVSAGSSITAYWNQGGSRVFRSKMSRTNHPTLSLAPPVRPSAHVPHQVPRLELHWRQRQQPVMVQDRPRRAPLWHCVQRQLGLWQDD
jgi:hypothetical protein